MTKDELAAMELKLSVMHLDLQEMEREFSAQANPVELDQAKVGRLSRMDAMQGQQMAMEATRRRQRQLLLVEAAQRRINTGEYGRCQECDEDIDIRRLQVDPACLLCIGCAQKRD